MKKQDLETKICLNLTEQTAGLVDGITRRKTVAA